MNCTLNLLVGIMKQRKKNKKKLVFVYRIYAYILLSSPAFQSESATVTLGVRHDATEVI